MPLKLSAIAIIRRAIMSPITLSPRQKIATVLAISTSVTTSLEALQRVLCIWYLVQIQNNKV